MLKNNVKEKRFYGVQPPSLKRSERRQLNHKLRQQQKREIRNMSEVCVCCGAPLGDAELGTMICKECSERH